MSDTDLLAVTPLDLLRLWTQEEIEIVCDRPGDLEDHPDLALRVRGALGNALAQAGSPVAHRHDPFARPSAFSVLFADEGDKRGRPFALDVDVMAETVLVRLRLFGAAGFWVDQVREGLLDALSGGVALRLGGRNRVPIPPRDCRQRRCGLADPPASCREAVLVFRSPVVVRSGNRLSGVSRALLWSAVARLRDLAPWHGVRLALDHASLEFDLAAAPPMEEAVAVRFQRHSRRQGAVPIPIVGQLGRLKLITPGSIMPFLVTGAETHIGSHAALGFGRYDVGLYP